MARSRWLGGPMGVPKSSIASAKANRSADERVPGTPMVSSSTVNSLVWSSVPAVLLTTCNRPAFTSPSTFSRDAPMTRSSRPSPVRSPEASTSPSRSPVSATSSSSSPGPRSSRRTWSCGRSWRSSPRPRPPGHHRVRPRRPRRDGQRRHRQAGWCRSRRSRWHDPPPPRVSRRPSVRLTARTRMRRRRGCCPRHPERTPAVLDARSACRQVRGEVRRRVETVRIGHVHRVERCEGIAELPWLADPERDRHDRLACARDESSGRPEQETDAALVRLGPDVFVGHTDRQIGEAVAVVVTACQRPSEMVAWLSLVGDARLVLVPDLVARGDRRTTGVIQPEPVRRAVDDVDDPGLGICANVVERRSDRQVLVAVVVEVGVSGVDPIRSGARTPPASSVRSCISRATVPVEPLVTASPPAIVVTMSARRIPCPPRAALRPEARLLP